jgi:hypothetical protein
MIFKALGITLSTSVNAWWTQSLQSGESQAALYS